MRKATRLLAILPVLALFAASAANATYTHPAKAKKKLVRLADEVADNARILYRTAAGRHDRHQRWGPGGNHGFYGPRNDYALTLLSNLEVRARHFEDALRRRPVVATHREFEALNRAFDRAARELYRVRVSPAVERDLDCVAEYLYSLNGLYEEVAYPRRVRYRGHGGYDRHDGRVEIYGPRWNITWRQDGWHGRDRGWRYDRDWDSDSDSDSY